MSDRVKVWVQRFKDRRSLMLQWLDPITGKRKTKSSGTDDPQDAEQRRADLEYELNHGLHSDPSKLTWEAFRDRYAAEKIEGDAVANQKKANVVLDSFERAVRPKRFADIDERFLGRYVTRLRKDGREPSTIKGYLAYLKVMLRWAEDQRIIPRAPKVPTVKIPKGTNRAKIRNSSKLTTESLERLLMFCPNDGWRLVVALAWYCGMRRGEIHAMRGDHIDLRDHLIRIPAGKSGDVSDTVTITPELDEFLRDLLGDDWPDGPLVIALGAPESLAMITKGFAAIARKAAVKGNNQAGYCTLHDLRRAFGSRWAAEVPAQVLRGMMRHASLSTTMEFYAETETAIRGIMWPQECNRSRNTIPEQDSLR